MQVQRVAIKIPPYWPKDPTLWFAQVEAQFELAKIASEQTKFHHVISSLSPEAATEVRDVILNPSLHPYTKLRECLINRTSESTAQRLKKALDATEIGDIKPTQILRKLTQQLEGMDPEAALVREVFLQKLPTNIRSIVASNVERMELAELAELADRIYDSLPPSDSINAIGTSSNNVERRLSRLESMIEQLATTNVRGRYRSPTLYRRFSRSSSRRRFTPGGKFCFYHWRFRNKARKCIAPCAWTTPETSSPSKNVIRQ
jgi:hypothetical protein